MLVFDISRQIERLKHNGSDLRIKADFDINIPENTITYALIIYDREIQLQSDGNRMYILMEISLRYLKIHRKQLHR